jgi:hypothetical protein
MRTVHKDICIKVNAVKEIWIDDRSNAMANGVVWNFSLVGNLLPFLMMCNNLNCAVLDHSQWILQSMVQIIDINQHIIDAFSQYIQVSVIST